MQKLDYTKYKLKPKEEILDILSSKNNIFIISCNKCFKEFTPEIEPECEELTNILKESGKNIVRCLPLDFLCNKYLTKKEIEKVNNDISKSDVVAVISCGLGIQTVADILSKSVYGVTDSLDQGGYHGITLSAEKCNACGNCFLTLTSGICPVVHCSKSLVNGPCGGAKNGKCEIDKNKECAWENIYKRLSVQNRTKEIVDKKPQLRDYSKGDFNFIKSYLDKIREKRYEGFYGGLYPEEKKELTRANSIEKFPEVNTFIIPLLQHTGAVCEPLVQTGDMVKVGQKIGDSKAFVSSPVHSSISGKVIAIELRKHPLLPIPVTSIVIESDKKRTYDDSIKPSGTIESLSKEKIIEIIKDKGIVGLGGAQFPTYVKLKSPKPIDTIIINGCECEPFLNSDYRIMIEYSKEIISGLKLIMRSVEAKDGIIAIEDNKPEAISKLSELVSNESNIKVVSVKTKYPEGAERMLIKRVLNREVPLGGLPFDVGVVVNNVSTVYAIWDAVYNGMPLVKRIVTVAGENVGKPGNYEILIGTPLTDIIKYCDIKMKDELLLKMGGPIMGISQFDYNVPIIKGTTGMVIVKKSDITDVETSCIKCGRCVDVCPMELKPSYYVLLAKENNFTEMEKHGVLNCIECGCCENICSCKSSIMEIIKKAKKIIREKKK
ncbi:MAG: electron transport complex subunit RsxC [Candidatus Firestonebacteria bacterium]